MTRIIRSKDFSDVSCIEGASCAFGVFDGIHLGHKFIIRDAIDTAENENHTSAIITFDIDPDEIFNPYGLKKVMSNERRIEGLSKEGADFVVVLDFNERLAGFSPLDFLTSLFSDNMPSSLHIGCDFCFGKEASGDVCFLQKWAKASGMEVFSRDLLFINGVAVTSTRIRDLLSKGDITEANRLLGHPYSICGDVVKGRGEGAKMGIRTANLRIPSKLEVLEEGVYGAYTDIEGEIYKTAVSVGVSPTFLDEATANIEAHILGFDDDIYSERLMIDVVERLRPLIKFESKSELIKTIEDDIAFIQKNL